MAEVNPKDLRIDIYSKSSMSLERYKCGIDNVRITHLPTGIFVICDSECLEHKDSSIIDCRACAMNKLRELMDVS